MPRQRLRVEATDLVRAEITDDGDRVLLTLADAGGGTVVLSLPASCLGDIMAAVPRHLPQAAAGTVHRVHSWCLEASAGAPDLTLTLQTPEGRAAAFHLTHGQVAAMATLANYGALSATIAKAIN